MKKTFVLVCMLSLIFSSMPVYATDSDDLKSESHTFYEASTGKTIEYYYDEYGNTYTYFNGEMCYIAVPAESKRITDPELIYLLENDIPLTEIYTSEKENNGRWIPSSSFDLTYGATFSDSHNFVSSSAWESDYLYCGSIPSSSQVRIKTDNYTYQLGLNRRISVVYFYYDEVESSWNSQSYSSLDLTGPAGQAFYLAPYNSYAKFGLIKSISDGLKSADIDIWM